MSLFDVNATPTSEPSRKQVTFELRHPGCWTLETTEALPDTKIVVKSAYRTNDTINADVILIVTGGVDIETFMAAIDRHPAVYSVTVLKQTTERARIVVNYDRQSSISPQIINSDFVPVEPVRIADGFEYWTVLVRTDQIGSKIQKMKDECDIEITSIRGFDPEEDIEYADVVDQIHNSLTTKQAESLLLADEEGYYHWPRKTAADEIASDLPISGPTYLEHLRKGEQKLIRTVLAELRKRHGAVTDAAIG